MRWAEPTLLFLPERLAVLIQIQPRLHVGFVVVVGQFEGLFFEFDRLGKIARFGVGGGERFDGLGVFPLGQLAGFGGIGDGLLAIAILLFGATGQQHGAGVERDGICGIEANGFGKIRQSLVILLAKVAGIAAIVVGDGFLRIEANGLV